MTMQVKRKDTEEWRW